MTKPRPQPLLSGLPLASGAQLALLPPQVIARARGGHGLVRLLVSTGLAAVIRHGEESVILGGLVNALASAEALACAQGAHCTRLRVQVSLPCSAMPSITWLALPG